MKNIFVVFFSLIIISTTFADNASKLKGSWSGALKISGVELRIVFNVSVESDTLTTATLDSPDQGAYGIKVDRVIFNDNTVRFDVNTIGGYYEGKFNPDSMQIDGMWNQGGQALPLLLKYSEKKVELNRPQEPKSPFPYNVEEVAYRNEDAGITLAGTLTTPKTGGPFPTAILISGSGPQNRDEEILSHKPFLVIADHLTKNGIAVLRFDDRGVGESTGNHSSATSKDFCTDVLAAIEFLKTRSEVDEKKIGLIGHSEGGMIAPMVASESVDVAFVVLLAGVGMRGDELLLLQSELISRAEGMDETEIKKNIGLSKKFYQIINTTPGDSLAKEKLLTEFDGFYNSLSEKEKTEIENVEQLKTQQLNILLSPWFRYFLSYDPVDVLKKVECPVLALNGEKDLQVPPKENLKLIEEALTAGGNNKFVVRELKGLNHLFQTSETGKISEYSKLEETFSPIALEEMLTWIKSVTN